MSNVDLKETGRNMQEIENLKKLCVTDEFESLLFDDLLSRVEKYGLWVEVFGLAYQQTQNNTRKQQNPALCWVLY